MWRVASFVLSAVAIGAAPAAADVTPSMLPPNARTPAGSATLTSPWRGAVPASAPMRQVVVGWKVVVGRGGHGGRVRVRLIIGSANHVGQWVVLPRRAGTYRFAAPHVDVAPGRRLITGLDQRSGLLAIVHRFACHGTVATAWCPYLSLDAYRLGDPAAALRQPISSRPGAVLTVSPILERDLDGDRLGDETEDRTDLQLRTTAVARGPSGTAVTVAVTNAGPASADLPVLVATAGAAGAWTEPCLPIGPGPHHDAGPEACRLNAISAGQTATRTYLVPDGVQGAVSIAVDAEGPDTSPADDTVSVPIP